MNVLIIGSGGREHAIAWKIAKSELQPTLFIAPGNAGTATLGTNIPVKADDFAGIKNAVLANKIDFVFVGPDDPLALGIVDYFMDDEDLKNIPILGPPAAGAKLESSKDFAKQFMLKHDIPTAAYRSFTKEEKHAAYNYLEKNALPIVVKADGLAAGKGVAVCQSLDEAKNFLDDIWEHEKFGKAGSKVVIEQFLSGIELSVFVLTDGKNYILLPEAKDYKRIGEGDKGANTGGMGAVSPVPFADKTFMDKVRERIIEPTIKGLQSDEIPFRGFVFIGLMNVNGDPYVIEYNARMGDPETQVVFPRIKTDLLPLFIEAAGGNLNSIDIEIDERFATTVIATSKGYPEAAETGKEISGLDSIADSIVFHAGTKAHDGKILSSGGRVLAFTSYGNSLPEALDKSYDSLSKICFDGINFRRDIGKDLLQFPVNSNQ
ncbi:MAG: phosphoribosylamine--glycine ligase [Sphingobacteriales bacterium]|nr:MAG: phosphoribosylamine--glycine ligase [Sphingobacteriales bacterium]